MCITSRPWAAALGVERMTFAAKRSRARRGDHDLTQWSAHGLERTDMCIMNAHWGPIVLLGVAQESWPKTPQNAPWFVVHVHALYCPMRRNARPKMMSTSENIQRTETNNT